MAGGNLDVVIPGAGRGDEIGDLAKTVTVIRENAEQKARDEAEAKIKQDQIAAQQRKADMIKLADDFEGAVGEIVETVSSASTELEASAGTLTSTAERAQELTTMVAAASEEASTNVQSVASATEEMSSSVNEISRQVQESARMASDAVDQARTTNDRVSELSKAAARIGDVVELINTIAGQTNLLALNATIEAARAGEAGRGFAVVASEVKALAEQTAKATGEIGQQITGIQAATQESVNAIKEISGTIEKLSEISSTIAAAVEEQGAATQEISRNVQQAAQGTQQVSVQHHRRAARRQRDRIGLLAGALRGAVAVRRQQPPQARGRQVPQLGARGLTTSAWISLVHRIFLEFRTWQFTNMIKLNRIGNKLGAVGLFGVLLSGGMVANQMVSEQTINSANHRAGVQQTIADHTLQGNIALRGMELAVRDIRQSKNPPELEKSLGGLNAAFTAVTRELDVAIGNVVKPDDKERLQKIRSLAVEYHNHASEIGKTQLRIFEITKKRNERSADWTKTFEGLLLSPALIRAANRSDVEKVLNEADSMFNAVRSATWRLIATGDEGQKQVIDNRTGGLDDTLDSARSIVSDTGLLGTINSLATR